MKFSIPAVTDTLSDVDAIQDSVTCGLALRAYRSVLDSSAQHAATVEVLKVKNVYIVSSPEGQAGIGEWTNRVVFDMTFKLLNNYLM